MESNQYENTAFLYDLDQRDVLTDDIPFYLEFAQKQSGPILEMGCGTGRVAIPLAVAGHVVTGLDLSTSMISVFKEKVGSLNPKIANSINVVHGNMADFSFSEKFKMIIAPFRAFQALTNKQDIASSLQCVKQHLADDGIFIINVFQPYNTLDDNWCFPETVQWERVDEVTGNKVVKKHSGERIDTDNQIIYPRFAYEITYSDGGFDRIEEKLALKYYYYEQMKSLLEGAGFAVIAEYGWYDKSEIKAGRELLFVCKKGS